MESQKSCRRCTVVNLKNMQLCIAHAISRLLLCFVCAVCRSAVRYPVGRMATLLLPVLLVDLGCKVLVIPVAAALLVRTVIIVVMHLPWARRKVLRPGAGVSSHVGH